MSAPRNLRIAPFGSFLSPAFRSSRRRRSGGLGRSTKFYVGLLKSALSVPLERRGTGKKSSAALHKRPCSYLGRRSPYERVGGKERNTRSNDNGVGSCKEVGVCLTLALCLPARGRKLIATTAKDRSVCDFVYICDLLATRYCSLVVCFYCAWTAVLM